MLYDPFNPRDGRLDRYIRATSADRRQMIATYPLDIRSATDDWPFIFQFYRWALLGHGAPMPVAVSIILACVVQVVVLSAALGLGFITIEIALLHKFTVFLGGPTYSMAVTLFEEPATRLATRS